MDPSAQGLMHAQELRPRLPNRSSNCHINCRTEGAFGVAPALRVAGYNDGECAGVCCSDCLRDQDFLTGKRTGSEDDRPVFPERIEHLLELRSGGGACAAAGIELEATGVVHALWGDSEFLPDLGVARFICPPSSPDTIFP
jgi:hypothetical protein